MNLKFWKKSGKNGINCQVRMRFAPSPTGFLHIGGLRTALYGYLFAKKNKGKFILRLEDTDIERYVKAAAEAIYDSLKWLGLEYDEGPDIGGPYGPYIQSQRLDIYKKYADELIAKGHAYYCFCGEKTLEEMRELQIAKKQAPKYDRRCLKLSSKEVQKNLAANKPRSVRMKIPDNRLIEFDDLIRGKISYNTQELDDQIILKSNGYPTYHLAVVVDDHLMKITHVTRTEEWLPSTPKHILLYEYLGWKTPEWVHLPLLLNPDKTKMSKRKGDVAVEDYIKKGYLPEAMVNFLAFLGWNPGLSAEASAKTGKEKEIYSMEELLKDFSLEKVHKAGAIFNIAKLNWYNQYYIKRLPEKELFEKCKTYFPENFEKFSREKIVKMLNLEKERSKTLSKIGESIKFFFELPKYDKKLLIWKNSPQEKIKESLKILCDVMDKIPENKFTKEKLEKLLMPEAEKLDDRGVMLWPLRASLSGQSASPGPFEIAEILGKEEALKRIKYAAELL